MRNKILIGIIVIVAIAVIALTFNKGETTKKVEGVDLSVSSGAEAFISKVYEPLGNSLPNLMTTTMDVNDINALTYNTGLTDNTGIEYVVVSEPMMSAQAYSLVLVKVSEDTDVQKIKQDVFNNVDTRKWICVEAENKYATDYDNTVIFLMAGKEWAEPVYSSIQAILGDAMGEELKEENAINSEPMVDGQMEAYPGDTQMDDGMMEAYPGDENLTGDTVVE